MEQRFFNCSHDSVACQSQMVIMCNATGDDKSTEALEFYPYQLTLIILYSITSFLAVGSNIVTIAILLRREHNSTELWKYLINLSVADISMAIFCIPFTYTVYMLGQWIFPHFLCRIIYFVQTTSVTVSIWTLTAIGIDRYFAILYPFRSILWIKKYKYTTIFSIWLFGILVAMPLLIHTRLFKFCNQGEIKYTCKEDFSDEAARLYTLILFFIAFLIPLIALSYVYIRICLHLLRHANLPGNPDRIRDQVNINRKIKVIKMLFTIVLVFAVCWLPIHMFQLCVWFYPDFQTTTYSSYMIYVATYFASHWLAMSHAFANPFIYCFMSDNFRQSLRQIYRRFTKGRDHEQKSRADLALTQSMVLTENKSTLVGLNKRGSLRAQVLLNHHKLGEEHHNHVTRADGDAMPVTAKAISSSQQNELQDEFV